MMQNTHADGSMFDAREEERLQAVRVNDILVVDHDGSESGSGWIMNGIDGRGLAKRRR